MPEWLWRLAPLSPSETCAATDSCPFLRSGVRRNVHVESILRIGRADDQQIVARPEFGNALSRPPADRLIVDHRPEKTPAIAHDIPTGLPLVDRHVIARYLKRLL